MGNSFMFIIHTFCCTYLGCTYLCMILVRWYMYVCMHVRVQTQSAILEHTRKDLSAMVATRWCGMAAFTVLAHGDECTCTWRRMDTYKRRILSSCIKNVSFHSCSRRICPRKYNHVCASECFPLQRINIVNIREFVYITWCAGSLAGDGSRSCRKALQ